MVGTQCDTVTFSDSLSLSRSSGTWRPGSTIFRPSVTAMNGKPHASAWNIDVIGMYTSSRWMRCPARGAHSSWR